MAFLCGSGHRSLLAAHDAAGRHRCRHVHGGMLAWRDAGLPTSTPAREDEAA